MRKNLVSLSLAMTVPWSLPAVAAPALEVSAQVLARSMNTVGATMSGTLAVFPLRDGDRFLKGSVIAAFDCRQQAAAVARAEAEQGKRKGLLSTQSRLKELGTYSKLDLTTAAADVKVADAELGVAKAVRESCTILAPFDGRVASVSVHPSQFVPAGTAMLDIVDDRDLEAVMVIPSQFLLAAHPGARITLALHELGAHPVEATVSRVSGRVDPVSRTVKVYATIKNPSGVLPGMSGDASFLPTAP